MAALAYAYESSFADRVSDLLSSLDCRLVDVDADVTDPGKTIRVGMPVELTWDDRTDEVSLPVFRPA